MVNEIEGDFSLEDSADREGDEVEDLFPGLDKREIIPQTPVDRKTVVGLIIVAIVVILAVVWFTAKDTNKLASFQPCRDYSDLQRTGLHGFGNPTPWVKTLIPETVYHDAYHVNGCVYESEQAWLVISKIRQDHQKFDYQHWYMDLAHMNLPLPNGHELLASDHFPHQNIFPDGNPGFLVAGLTRDHQSNLCLLTINPGLLLIYIAKSDQMETITGVDCREITILAEKIL